MPTRCTIEKYHAGFGEFWVNVYHLQGSDLDAAISDMDALVAAERPLYGANVSITKARVDDGAAGTDNFRTKIYNQAGTRDIVGLGGSLPMFAVGRCDFTVADGGRPCRKYIRFLQESDSDAINVGAAALALLNTYADAVVAVGVTDPIGNAITDGAAMQQIAMRQVRRGSKKKVTP